MKPIKIEPKNIKKHSVAPYNFVALQKPVVVKYNGPQELPPHNNFRGRNKEELLGGYIKYILKSETPILVSRGLRHEGGENRKAKFFINSDGQYAIPGNTIRGMVRANAQILSFSDIVGKKDEKGRHINSYIEDSRFLYRDLTSGTSLNKKYKDMLAIDSKGIARNVKVGYITKKGDGFFIQPAMELKEGVPYFRIAENNLKKKIGGKNIKGINFLADGEKNGEKDSEKDGKKYEPYQVKISFKLDGKGAIIGIGEVGEYNCEGYILSGGFITGKRSHYIVPAEKIQLSDEKMGKIEITEDCIRIYKNDMLATKKAYIEDGKFKVYKEYKFYALPENNEKKPIFYIKIDEKTEEKANEKPDRLYFGFIPFLRLGYSKTVLDGVADGCKGQEGISYTDAIFGFANKLYKNNENDSNISYKSRVSFEDAEVIGKGVVDEESVIDIILAEPKPTSYNLYLNQNKDKKELNIYEGDFNIRGIKQYWLKNYVEKPELKVGEAENMRIRIHPLKENTEFQGKIYFNNLDEEELGLLIWALKLEDNCYQNIGLAKPYGFGRVKVKDIKLNIEDLNKKYNSFSFCYYKEDNKENNIDKYVNTYKNNFSNKYLNGKRIEKEKPIKDLIHIKSQIVEPEDANNYGYMKLEEFKEKKVLPELSLYEQSIGYLHKKDKLERDKYNKSEFKKGDSKFKKIKEQGRTSKA